MQGQVTVDTFDDTPLAGDSDQRAARQEVTEFHGYYGAECGTSFGTAARDTQRHSSTPPSSSALQPKLSSPIAPPSTASVSLTLQKQTPPVPSYYRTYGQQQTTSTAIESGFRIMSEAAERQGEVSSSGGGMRARCRHVDRSVWVCDGRQQHATRQRRVRGGVADEAERA